MHNPDQQQPFSSSFPPHHDPLSEGDPYLPDWERARLVGLSSRVGTYEETSDNICPDTREVIDKEEIPLCQNTKTLEFLGFGFPLYYMFIRNCILLLALIIACIQLVSLYLAINFDGFTTKQAHHHHKGGLGHGHNTYQGQFNFDPQAITVQAEDYGLFTHLARIVEHFSIYDVPMRVGAFCLQVIMLLYMKHKLLNTAEYLDERASDLSDYSVLVSCIPPQTPHLNQRLRQTIANQFKGDRGQELRVHEITLFPEVHELTELKHQEEHAVHHYLQARQEEPQLAAAKLHHIKQIEEKIDRFMHETTENIRTGHVPCSNAIVIFETEEEKMQFLEKSQDRQIFYDHSGVALKFEEAPEPRQIVFENIEHRTNRAANILKGWLLSLLFLGVAFGVFYLLQMWKSKFIEQNEEGPNTWLNPVIAYGIMFLVILFNKFIMGSVLHSFTHLEHHFSHAEEELSFAAKYALGMFFTTALMTVIVEALGENNYYKNEYGVIGEETIMFFFSAFIIPLNWLINPYRLCHLWEREKHIGRLSCTQEHANHLMKDYHYSMGKRYAELLEMMWFTFLYEDLLPVGPFLILIGLGLYYWIDKYTLLRRSSLQSNINTKLPLGCLRLLDLCLVWKYIGQIIFDTQIRDGITPLSILFLVLSVIFLLVPWADVLDYVDHEEFNLNDRTYTEEENRFRNEHYRLYHPYYKRLAQVTRHHQPPKSHHSSIGQTITTRNHGHGPISKQHSGYINHSVQPFISPHPQPAPRPQFIASPAARHPIQQPAQGIPTFVRFQPPQTQMQSYTQPH